MIPFLSSLLGHIFPDFMGKLGGYITVRASGALIVAFVLSLLFGNRTINFLKRLKVGQYVRDDQGDDAISLKEMHLEKVGTPTMGGVLMILSWLVAIVLFGNWSEPVLWLAALTTLGFAMVGYVDDYRKVVQKKSEGLSVKEKLFVQSVLCIFFALFCILILNNSVTYSLKESMKFTDVAFPFFKSAILPLGFLFIVYVLIVLNGTTNAVNLTDGLDGLASGVAISVALAFCIIAYLVGRTDATEYLLIPFVQGAGELSVLLAALIGSCFGFLWFNCYPAKMFMGDTGSMFIGGAIGTVALLTKQEILILIIGGVFVAEAVSVLLQVGSYKLRKKRIFLMAPLHHHFERLGINESQIIVRFWMVSALLALAGISTLKLR